MISNDATTAVITKEETQSEETPIYSPDEDSANTTQLYFKGVSKTTTDKELSSHFEPWGARLQLYKSAKMGFDSPYGFLLCDNDKVQTLLQQEHEINGSILEINYARRKVYTMKYFLDSRTTKGAIGEISENILRDYFGKFGEVTRINIEATKGIGFVDLNVPENSKQVQGLAWKTHTIDGHVIDVQESSSKRKRKRRGGKSFSKRIKPTSPAPVATSNPASPQEARAALFTPGQT